MFTIGAYGFNGRAFMGHLRDARIDVFVDIRARRGVRGAEYAFANAARLEASLARAGIRYVHALELAPPQEVRDVQDAEDQRTGTARRNRSHLSDAFIKAYRARCLTKLDARRFVEKYCTDARLPVLFCVEREPEACHRSLVAEQLSRDLGVKVEHLMP